jgi:hypothetical protein
MPFKIAHVLIAITGIVLCLAACTIQGTDSKRLDPSAQKVTAMQVLFNGKLPDQARSSGAVGATIVAQREATSATSDYGTLFSNGFRDRFPALARAYGLEVSGAAGPRLLVNIVRTETYCYAKCTTRATLSAILVDQRGKRLWQFVTKPGQSSTFAKIDDGIFDAAAHELLDSMKKDGVI